MGIETLETDTFKLHCFQSLTGAKFVVTATPGTNELENLLHAVYEIYADYVLKVRVFFCDATDGFCHFLMQQLIQSHYFVT